MIYVNIKYQILNTPSFYIYLDCPSDFCPRNSSLLDSDVGPENVSCGQETSQKYSKRPLAKQLVKF